MKNLKVLNAAITANLGSIVSVTAEVEQKVLKRGNPLKDAEITKLVKVTCQSGTSYENTVNNQRVREGEKSDFSSVPNWMEATEFSAFVQKKSDPSCKYLRLMVVPGTKSENLGYFVNGKPATEQEIAIIEKFKQVSTPPTNQGVDRPVIYRTFKVSGLKSIRVGGVEITV